MGSDELQPYVSHAVVVKVSVVDEDFVDVGGDEWVQAVAVAGCYISGGADGVVNGACLPVGHIVVFVDEV